jgi:hypothetical protein
LNGGDESLKVTGPDGGVDNVRCRGGCNGCKSGSEEDDGLESFHMRALATTVAVKHHTKMMGFGVPII